MEPFAWSWGSSLGLPDFKTVAGILNPTFRAAALHRKKTQVLLFKLSVNWRNRKGGRTWEQL